MYTTLKNQDEKKNKEKTLAETFYKVKKRALTDKEMKNFNFKKS